MTTLQPLINPYTMSNLTSKDLRIGNKVYSSQVIMRDEPPPSPFTVSSISTSGIAGHFVQFEETGQHPIAIESLYGVPLTPSILEAAGFKKSKAWVGVWSFVDKKNDVLFTIMEDSEGKFCHIQTNKSIKIEYVHDLQNVFYCLNNKIELTINLNQLQKA